MSELIISVSGLRGIVGETLTPDVACRFVAAFAAQIPEGPVGLVGHSISAAIAFRLAAANQGVDEFGPAMWKVTRPVAVERELCQWVEGQAAKAWASSAASGWYRLD